MKRVLGEEDFPFPTEKQIRAELENDLRRISREESCERVATLEARRREAEKAERREFIPEDDLPVHAPVRQQREPRAIKPEKPSKAIKPGKAPIPDGYRTITQLCEEWKILPMHARACLRASDLTKPPYGWAFSPSEVPNIKKICGVK